ncbi:MAG: 1,4-alpha-glucan branching protein domain-containing protein [Deferribacterota bacterium]|nr:1,4-alpha-glucan branching protein domain-containing protein [Deferribacterota bacterium]
MKGYWVLVLHSHLPFVKHPEYSFFLEEKWLFEAIDECYIPLLMLLKRLEEEHIYSRFTVSLSPTLCEMLVDTTLLYKYEVHLEKQIELANKEVERTKKDAIFNEIALFYLNRYKNIKSFFYEFLNKNVLKGFKYFKDIGKIEIITCAATHGLLPLLQVNTAAIKAQIHMAVTNYNKHFEESPKGIWLPECAYYVGLEEILAEFGIRYFFLDAHGVLYSEPRPKYGVFAPVYTEKGVATFARDIISSKQVWSAEEGYPGDFNYRDFYRDIGFDLDFNYIKDYINPDGVRVFTGFKYYKITGKTDYKEPYDYKIALEKTAEHAGHFVNERYRQLSELSKLMDRKPVIVSPYDSELFGHWWFEGHEFLYNIFKNLNDSGEIKAITPLDYLKEYPANQVVSLNPSSWGDKGYYEVWLNGANDWIYRHLHYMADKMVYYAKYYINTVNPFRIRLLNQMARELLLAQSSDWAFLITTKTADNYATKRTKEHIFNFLRLEELLNKNYKDEHFLTYLENKNSIFQDISFKIYAK